MADADRLLRIYMTDQLALGILWREIARRAHNSASGSAEGDALGRVASAIAEPREQRHHGLHSGPRLAAAQDPAHLQGLLDGERADHVAHPGHVTHPAPGELVWGGARHLRPATPDACPRHRDPAVELPAGTRRAQQGSRGRARHLVRHRSRDPGADGERHARGARKGLVERERLAAQHLRGDVERFGRHAARSHDERVVAPEAAGRVVAVPFVYRFHPMAREARARVAAGDLGRLHLLHGTYLQDWLLTADDTNWRVDAALGGPSRAFADIGAHWCDLVEFVGGRRIAPGRAPMATTVPARATGVRAPLAAPGAPASAGGDPAPRRAPRARGGAPTGGRGPAARIRDGRADCGGIALRSERFAFRLRVQRRRRGVADRRRRADRDRGVLRPRRREGRQGRLLRRDDGRSVLLGSPRRPRRARPRPPA